MGQIALGLALVVLGSLLAIPAIVLLGLVLGIVELVRQVWVARGMGGVEYRRGLPHRRAVVGDALPLDLTVWNAKLLPLGWLRVDDEASAGVVVRERPLVEAEDGTADVLRNAWTLAPWERVTRHLHIQADRRGLFTLGPARLQVGDLFARPAAEATVATRDSWLVRPRSVHVEGDEPTNPWGGELRARSGLIEDRARYAGIRPYQPGDPVRSVHWRATARLGTPVVRRFEPGRHRELLVALDLDTGGPSDLGTAAEEEMVEELCVAAASIIRRLRADGAAVGIAAAAWSGSPRALAWLSPSASDGQLGRCLDVIARLTAYPSAPFGRLVTTAVRSLRPGTRLLVVTARDPGSYLAVLRRAAQSGYPVEVIALGGRGPEAVARARAAGLGARAAALDGPWRTARTLVIGA